MKSNLHRKEGRKKAGEFKKKKEEYKLRQKVFDACKRARAGEEEVWVTVKDDPFLEADAKFFGHSIFVRAKLKPIDPMTLHNCDYACEYGYGAIIMCYGEPRYFQLAGKDGVIYGPTGHISPSKFKKQCLAIVEEIHQR